MFKTTLELDLDIDSPLLKGTDVTRYVANYVSPYSAVVLEPGGALSASVVELTFLDKGQALAWFDGEGLDLEQEAIELKEE